MQELDLTEMPECNKIKEEDPVFGISSNWDLTDLTDNEMVFTHTFDIKVKIIHDESKDDKPFSVIRVSAQGDQYRIGKSDFLTESLNIAKGYILGFDEKGLHLIK